MQMNQLIGTGVVLALAGSSWANSFDMSSGHADILVGYDAGSNELEIEVELVPGDGNFTISPDLPNGVDVLEPNEIRFVSGAASFVPGEGVWRFGEDFAPGVLFLGWGAEEVSTGVFENDTLSFELVGITGPGNFRLFDLDQFNQEVELLPNPGTFDVFAESADHFSFEFDAAGIYELEVRARGTLIGGQELVSESATLTFVIPTPGAGALAALGLAAAARRRRG
ncbi:MAG: choice-of-anchor M domain-containing protein [Planctomycetota bacterium]